MQEKSNSHRESVYTVSVIGYAGSTTEHVRVGKSCLIHRFLSHTPYSEDHLSIISRSDFDGEVVGGSHWLYWGDCNINTSHACGHLRIIEQCEFLDDLLYSPLSSPAPYVDRCLEREITVSSRKLAYICKNQLGDESSFPRSYINVGNIHVSAFMFAYDITLDGSAAFHQAAFLQKALKELSRMDVPLVLVTTKHDCSWSPIAESLLTISLNEKIKKRWIERRFRLVETSARSNINVEEAFQSVFLIASGKCTPKIYKPSNGSLEQRMKSLAIRLRRPLQ
ncbi:hypothetical protein FBUS_11248 [Fasciolopsis buskii]|uniref:Uncharacterized protein n=1 Tax=Fasciolopsis buskii TaxID=27845 RepID=A0A8E0RSL0_9TREM|nr:hypothetical protein FBUS_11248 [Fasciolopsis buski]